MVGQYTRGWGQRGRLYALCQGAPAASSTRLEQSVPRAARKAARTVAEAGGREVALLDVAYGDGHPAPPLRPVAHPLAELLDWPVQVYVGRLGPLIGVVYWRLQVGSLSISSWEA